MNDPKLKLAMAKLLPEKISIGCYPGTDDEYDDTYYWRPDLEYIREVEWLYVMHLVWLTVDRKQRVDFSVRLREEVIKSGGHASSFNEDIIACCENATFNQRAAAMRRVKGIEL